MLHTNNQFMSFSLIQIDVLRKKLPEHSRVLRKIESILCTKLV